MKRKELEATVKELGLEFSVENNIGKTIMQVWQPYAPSGFKIDSKYYSASSLGKSEVESLNSKFRNLLKVLEENKIRITNSSNIENGVISTWVLHLKDEPLKNEERNVDFDIDTELFDGVMVYSRMMPAKIGYRYSNFRTTTLYSNDKLKKHELELMLKNIEEIIESLDDKRELLVDFSIKNNTVEPIKYLIEKGIMAPRIVIELLFTHDDIYYDNQKEFLTILKYLTTLKAENINILNNNRRGSLPDLILDLGYLYKSVLKNWEFEKDTGQKILTMMVRDDKQKQFRMFIEAKSADRYYFREWHDLQEYVLKFTCADNPKLLKKLIEDGWMALDNVSSDYFLDFLYEAVNSISVESYVLVMDEFMGYFGDMHDTLLSHLFDKFDHDDLHDTMISRELMEAFLKRTDLKPPKPFMTHNAAIMIYLKDDHPLRKELLSNGEFVQYIVSVGKTEFLPETVKDIFLF